MAPIIAGARRRARAAGLSAVDGQVLRELALVHVPGHGEPRIEALRGGSLNCSFKVTRDERPCVLRVDAGSCGTAPAPGVDRAWERRVLQAAAGAGIGPRIVACEPAAGVLVTAWVDGVEWSAEHAAAPASQAQMAGLVRRVHALIVPEPVRRMSVRDWRDLYREQRRHEAPDSQESLRLAQLDMRAESLLDQYEALSGARSCLCHSDLYRHNVLWSGQCGCLLDWEYAHVGDPFWDLAGWTCSNALSPAARNEFVNAYLGRKPRPDEQARLALLMRLYDSICASWAALAAAQPPRAP